MRPCEAVGAGSHKTMTLQEKLHALFLLDKQVRGMRSRLDSATSRQKNLTTKLNQLTLQRTELTIQIKVVQAKAASLEHQSDDLEKRVVDLREKMTKVTSNKEYSALLLEVNTLKLDKGQIEEQAIEQLNQVESLQASLVELTEKVGTQEKMVEGAASEVKQHESEVGEKLAELTTERDAAAGEVPREVLNVFNRLADNYDGEAMAPVIEESRRSLEYNCGGCFMSIPVEAVNALVMKPQQATICPNCGRMLYLQAELRATMVPKG